MNISAISNAQQAYMYNNYHLHKKSEVSPVEQEATPINPNFKGLGDIIGKLFGKFYAKPMIEANWTRNLSERLSKVPGSMTEHMATLGSMITSSVYMTRTLSNKELESDKKKTLAINQFLCFLVPTIAAYTVNSLLKGFNKKLEYRYAGIQEQKLALGKLTPEQAKKMREATSGRLKGFSTLAALGTFTLIYRYITPVIITPAANWIGRKSQERKEKQLQKQLAVA